MSGQLSVALAEMRRDQVVEAVGTRARMGEDPLLILEECRRGMNMVGDRYQTGEYFLSQLLLSAQIFNEALAVLEPHLARTRPSQPLGRILLATMAGDIHDMGKNIFSTLLRAQGFEVCDLGVDVVPELVVEKVAEAKPQFVGFSVLITTAFDSMKRAADMLQDADLRRHIKLMVGGGVTTPEVQKYVGADFQTTDAMEGVLYCVAAAKGE